MIQMVRTLLFCLLVLCPFVMTGQDDWKTFYERSGGLRTPTYAETMDFCHRLADASPVIAMGSFGTSGQGRDLAFLVADKDGLSEPGDIRARGRIVVLVQACIHPGESEGKDAGLVL